MLRVRGRLACALVAGLTAASTNASADLGACLQSAERAQALRRGGGLRQARAQLISCSAAACPNAVRADCSRWLGEVEAALPSVILQARDASGQDVVDAKVTIDGVVQQRALDGLAIPLDPGTRVFRFEAGGREPVQQILALREGEKSRLVSAVLVRPPSPSDPGAVVPDAPRRSAVPAAAWLVGGAGLLMVGGGVVLWVRGVNERDDLRDRCASPSSCTASSVDAAKTELRIGDILVGAGALAIGASVWIALRSSAPASPSTNVTFAPRGVAIVQTF